MKEMFCICNGLLDTYIDCHHKHLSFLVLIAFLSCFYLYLTWSMTKFTPLYTGSTDFFYHPDFPELSITIHTFSVDISSWCQFCLSLLSLVRGFHHAVRFRVAEISFDYFSYYLQYLFWNIWAPWRRVFNPTAAIADSYPFEVNKLHSMKFTEGVAEKVYLKLWRIKSCWLCLITGNNIIFL